MMKSIFLSILFGCSAMVLKAQEGRYFYLNLNVQKPLSNTEWVDDLSARAGKVGYRVFITPRFSAGVDIGWATFDEYKPTRTIEYTNGAITTDYFNYIYSYSGAISGQYNFPIGEKQLFIPYVGIGLGASHHEYTQYYNIYTDADRSWGFLARPEAGILVRFGTRRTLGAMAAIHYDYTTNRSKLYGYDNFSAIGFQLGLILLDL
jgi:outer membrane protein W